VALAKPLKSGLPKCFAEAVRQKILCQIRLKPLFSSSPSTIEFKKKIFRVCLGGTFDLSPIIQGREQFSPGPEWPGY
jgi:hypothetical protein